MSLESAESALLESEGNFLFILHTWAELDIKRMQGLITPLEQISTFSKIIASMGIGFLQVVDRMNSSEVDGLLEQVEECQTVFKEHL